jgi:multiple sugar transport system ATP-binding protein
LAGVSFSDVSKVYADGTRAVSGFDLEVAEGEFMVLVGPSGCGKTTALRMLAGLEDVSGGVIKIGGRVVNRVPPKDRDIAMVFQNYALYPHLTVYDNIGFGLKLRKVDRKEIDARVQQAARVLGLEEYLHRKPRALSGGQRQRVAMGRAIVREPQAFLMDEPLSNLDAKLRVQMRSEIGRLQRDLGVTTIYVTHDQIEAMTMADRVAVMRKGELQQVASPQHLYDHPVNLFVAGFIGSPTMNMLSGKLERSGDQLVVTAGDQRLTLAPEVLEQRPSLSDYIDRPIVVGVRPEGLEDPEMRPTIPEDQRLHGEVVLIEALGSEVIVHFRVAAPPVLTEDALELAKEVGTEHKLRGQEHEQSQTSDLIARFSAGSKVRMGDRVEVAVDPHALHFFDLETGLGIYGAEPTDEKAAEPTDKAAEVSHTGAAASAEGLRHKEE